MAEEKTMINEDQQKLLEFQVRENVKKELLKGYKKQIIAYVTAVTFILGLFGIQLRSWVIQKAEEQVKIQVEETVKKLEDRDHNMYVQCCISHSWAVQNHDIM